VLWLFFLNYLRAVFALAALLSRGLQMSGEKHVKRMAVLARLLLVVVILQELSACAVAGSDHILPEPLSGPAPISFKLTDARPEEEKSDQAGNQVNQSCGFGISRSGDGETTPDRVTYLATRLQETLGGLLAGKLVVLRHFSLYENRQAEARRVAAHMNTAMLAGPVNGGLPPAQYGVSPTIVGGCRQGLLGDGGFDPAEHADDTPANVAVVQIQWGGKVFNGRGVATGAAGAVRLAVDSLLKNMGHAPGVN
jgi:hypothetical protein